MSEEQVFPGASVVEFRPTWPDLDMSVVDGGRRPAPKFPLQVFGDWGEWIAAHAESRSAPVDYVAAGLLATTSALIGNARWVSPWAGWSEPPTLWLALVGNPSSGKSPALDASMDLLRHIEGEMADSYPAVHRRFQRDREEAKAVREIWQSEVKEAAKNGKPAPEMPERAVEPNPPVRPRLLVSDATIEALGNLLAVHPKGLLFQRDELAGWLGNFDRYGGAGGDRAFWAEAFGGRRFVIDRVKHDKEPTRIPHLSIAACGGIQPDRLSTLLMTGDDDGLAGRFLMTWPEPCSPSRPTKLAEDGLAGAALRRLLNLQMSENEIGEPVPTIVRLDGDAAALFQEWREANCSDESGASGLYLSHVGKMPGMVLRLALVLEYLHWSFNATQQEPLGVGERSLGFAAHFIDDYFKPMAQRVYGDAALPEVERHASAIAKRICRERSPKVNARQIYRQWKPHGVREPGKAKAALAFLVESGWLIPDPASYRVEGGRPRDDYLVNPCAYEAPQ